MYELFMLNRSITYTMGFEPVLKKYLFNHSFIFSVLLAQPQPKQISWENTIKRVL